MGSVRFVLAAACVALLTGCGAELRADGPHKHLGPVVRGCEMLGGGTAFYVCQPGFSIADLPTGHVVRWTLTGTARSSNGRTTFEDDNGIAQVVLENSRPFGPTGRGGVRATGDFAAGTTVFFAFSPTRLAERGYAVWKLRRPATALTASTANGSSATLVVDGLRLRPALVIAPSHELHDEGLSKRFASDMQHLAAVARGDVAGACDFYNGSSPRVEDADCARGIGHLDAAAVERSIAGATIVSYNGYTLAYNEIGGQRIGWLLADGHFRLSMESLTD